MPDTTEHPRRWATRETAAEYLSISPFGVDRLARAGKITRYKVGRLPRFDLNEIDAMMLGNRLGSARPAGATRDE